MEEAKGAKSWGRREKGGHAGGIKWCEMKESNRVMKTKIDGRKESPRNWGVEIHYFKKTLRSYHLIKA